MEKVNESQFTVLITRGQKKIVRGERRLSSSLECEIERGGRADNSYLIFKLLTVAGFLKELQLIQNKTEGKEEAMADLNPREAAAQRKGC